MPEPTIERVKTSVHFTDMNGVEWEVLDGRRRHDGRIWHQYPGLEDAGLRFFSRYAPPDGAHDRKVLEVRCYRFKGGESRWFDAKAWQRQLNVAETTRRSE